jgi:hypothetical protein
MTQEAQWTKFASELEGDGYAIFHRQLSIVDGKQLEPGFPSADWGERLHERNEIARAEVSYVEATRKEIEPLTRKIPTDADAFVRWFEALREHGPGQGDPLFPWLESAASLEDMKWFIEQEVAGEAGFDDLVALTQVKMPAQAKLEMARNYWDEMGRGTRKGMHGPMLALLAQYLSVDASPDRVVPEALALGNMMLALAHNRQYAFHSIGALGVIEMTAPTRAGYVERGLRRLGVPTKKRHYFALHAVLDVKHSQAWNREVLRPLVEEDPRRARAIGEGAILRLWHGLRCFERYRQRFDVAVAGAWRAA